MAELKKSRNAQTILSAEFTFNFDDTMVLAAGGAAVAFSTVAAHAVDVAALPRGATVVGGELVTDTTFTGSTAVNMSVGDATSDVRYLGSTNKLTAGRTALVPTGFKSTGEAIRLTVTPTVAPATAGKATLRVWYTLENRVSEVYIK